MIHSHCHLWHLWMVVNICCGRVHKTAIYYFFMDNWKTAQELILPEDFSCFSFLDVSFKTGCWVSSSFCCDWSPCEDRKPPVSSYSPKAADFVWYLLSVNREKSYTDTFLQILLDKRRHIWVTQMGNFV